MTVYLDHNATTPVRHEAAEAVARALTETGNPSSVHGQGRVARRLIEDARDQVAALVGARAEDVIFTSGGTEANNLALASGVSHISGDDVTTVSGVITSAVEHVSVLDAVDTALRAPVDGDGVIDLNALDDMLVETKANSQGGNVLVSVMLANNETGVLQPIEQLGELSRGHAARMHCDAVQAVGKMPIDFAALGVQMLSLSAHKIGGPAGVGALIVAPGVKVKSILRGGGQERSRRAGTENLPGIVGLGVAAEVAAAELPLMQELSVLRDEMEAEISKAASNVKFYGQNRDRLPTTSCLSMPGVSSETQVMAFDLDDIAVSAGSACSSGKVAPSHVLKAMGVTGDGLASALRVSLGWTTKKSDVTTFINAWKSLYARLGRDSLAA